MRTSYHIESQYQQITLYVFIIEFNHIYCLFISMMHIVNELVT